MDRGVGAVISETISQLTYRTLSHFSFIGNKSTLALHCITSHLHYKDIYAQQKMFDELLSVLKSSKTLSRTFDSSSQCKPRLTKN